MHELVTAWDQKAVAAGFLLGGSTFLSSPWGRWKCETWKCRNRKSGKRKVWNAVCQIIMLHYAHRMRKIIACFYTHSCQFVFTVRSLNRHGVGLYCDSQRTRFRVYIYAHRNQLYQRVRALGGVKYFKCMSFGCDGSAKIKPNKALHENLSYGVTCHPTQVNATCIDASQ